MFTQNCNYEHLKDILARLAKEPGLAEAMLNDFERAVTVYNLSPAESKALHRTLRRAEGKLPHLNLLADGWIRASSDLYRAAGRA